MVNIGFLTLLSRISWILLFGTSSTYFYLGFRLFDFGDLDRLFWIGGDFDLFLSSYMDGLSNPASVLALPLF